MSGQDACPNCESELAGDQRCHKCGWPNLLAEPEMAHIDGSEIEGIVDVSIPERPFMINQDGKDFLTLTRSDAKRLLKFLEEAIPYMERQAGMKLQ